MSQLTWADLLIDDFTPDLCRAWIAPWHGVVDGTFAPAFLNKFGFWFIRRQSGPVEMLDVYTGHLQQVADSYESFVRDVNEQWWQEVYLLSEHVAELHAIGKVPAPGQCYALAPHPAMGGPNPFNGDAIDPRFVLIVDIVVWQAICAQALGIAPHG